MMFPLSLYQEAMLRPGGGKGNMGGREKREDAAGWKAGDDVAERIAVASGARNRAKSMRRR